MASLANRHSPDEFKFTDHDSRCNRPIATFRLLRNELRDVAAAFRGSDQGAVW